MSRKKKNRGNKGSKKGGKGFNPTTNKTIPGQKKDSKESKDNKDSKDTNKDKKTDSKKDSKDTSKDSSKEGSNEGPNKGDGEKKDGDSKDGSKDGEKKDGDSKDGSKDGEKKDGDSKDSKDGSKGKGKKPFGSKSPSGGGSKSSSGGKSDGGSDPGWGSIFGMLTAAFKARRVLKTAVGIISDIATSGIDDKKIAEAKNIVDSLSGVINAVKSLSSSFSDIKPVDKKQVASTVDVVKVVINGFTELLHIQVDPDSSKKTKALQTFLDDSTKVITSVGALSGKLFMSIIKTASVLPMVMVLSKLIVMVMRSFSTMFAKMSEVPMNTGGSKGQLDTINGILDSILHAFDGVKHVLRRMLFARVRIFVLKHTLFGTLQALYELIDVAGKVLEPVEEKTAPVTPPSPEQVVKDAKNAEEGKEQEDRPAPKPETPEARVLNIIGSIGSMINHIIALSKRKVKVKKVEKRLNALVEVIAMLPRIMEAAEKSMPKDPQAMEKFNMLKNMIFDLQAVVKALYKVALLAMPLALPGIGLIFRLVIKRSFKVIIDLLTWISDRASKMKSVTADLKQLQKLIMLVATTIIVILLLGVVGGLVLKVWKGILINFVLLTVVVGAMYLFGMLMNAGGAAAVMAAAKGFGLIALAVGILLLTVYMIALIGKIEIDKEAVSNNIKAIFDIVIDMVMGLATSLMDHFNPSGNSNPAIKAAMGIVGLVATVAGLILMLPLLLAAIISVAAVLMIASMLKLIELLNLNPDRIKEQVEGVLDLTSFIIEKLFSAMSIFDENDDKSKNGLLENLLDIVAPSLRPIVTAATMFVTIFFITFTVLFLLLIGGMLKLIEYIDLDTQKIKDTISNIFECIGLIVESFNKDIVYAQGSGGFLDTVVQWLSPTVYAMWQSFSMFINLAFMVGSIAMINLLGWLLKGIQNIDLDADLVKDKVKDIFDCIGAIQHALSGEWSLQTVTDDGIFGTIAKAFGFGGMWKLVNSLLQLGTVASLFGIIALIDSMGSSLNSIANMDTSKFGSVNKKTNTIVTTINGVGKSIMDRDLIDTDDLEDTIESLTSMEDMYKKILDITTSMSKAGDIDLKKVVNVKVAFDQVKTISTSNLSKFNYNDKREIRHLSEVVEVATDIVKRWSDLKIESADSYTNQTKAVSTLLSSFTNIKFDNFSDAKVVNNFKYSTSKIVDTIEEVSEMKVDQLDTVNKYMTSSVTSLSNNLLTISKLDIDDQKVAYRIGLLRSLNRYLQQVVNVDDSAVRNSKEITDNYVKLLDRLDRSDLEKLQVTERMLRNWADLSQSIRGNFEGFAQSINEHIAPTLQELNTTMDEVRKLQQSIMKELGVDPNNGLGNSSGFDAPTGSAGSSPDGGSSSGGSFAGSAPAANNPSPASSRPSSSSSGPDGSRERPFYVKTI